MDTAPTLPEFNQTTAPNNTPPPRSKKSIMFLAIFLALISIIFTITFLLRYTTLTQQNEATSSSVPSCPGSTQLLFSKVGTLSVGSTVGGGGKVTALNGSWIVDSQDGRLMAESGRTITVEFPSSVYMDTALVYDNDPKSGEKPWSINGKSLPTTPDNKWAPAFKLDISSNQMKFDYGGDSPHFNVCLGNTPTPTPSKTPTPTATKTPTPKPSSTVTPVPSSTITPTPTMCPKPAAVTNVRINCPLCQ